MNSDSLEYKKKVWRFLEEIEPEKKYTIARVAKPENRGAFVEAVKEYMSSLPYNGWISFNSDYSKIYKNHPVSMEKLIYEKNSHK